MWLSTKILKYFKYKLLLYIVINYVANTALNLFRKVHNSLSVMILAKNMFLDGLGDEGKLQKNLILRLLLSL